MNRRKLAIYVHIPFCVKKCLYCDFLSAKGTAAEKQEYVDALIKEIEYYGLDDSDLNSQYEVATVFFGGGTPSILEAAQIGRILEAIRNRFNMVSCDVPVDKQGVNNTDGSGMAAVAEITIECNPGTATKEKLQAWKEMGINRISIGLQSANDDELKHLGRIHNYQEFLDTYNWAREAGFENINIDLMSAIPGQTLESYSQTLEKVIKLKPEHISSYSLIVEEETPFYDIYGEDKESTATVNIKGEVVPQSQMGADMQLWPDLPDEDTEREMYYLTDQLLRGAGYHRYEISNYSMDGYECAHNKSYWDGTEYIGFGLGASSYIKNIRYSNTDDWYKYIGACNNKGNAQNQPYYVGAGDYSEDDDFEEELEASRSLSREEFGQILLAEKYHEAIQLMSVNEQMEEFMYLGLRMMKGISKEEFRSRFHKNIEEVYGTAIDKLRSEGLLDVEADVIRLTAKGIDVSNRVLANFLL